MPISPFPPQVRAATASRRGLAQLWHTGCPQPDLEWAALADSVVSPPVAPERFPLLPSAPLAPRVCSHQLLGGFLAGLSLQRERGEVGEASGHSGSGELPSRPPREHRWPPQRAGDALTWASPHADPL